MFWIFIVLLIILGIVGMFIIASRSGNYDFITPLVAAGFMILCITLAIGLVIGRYI